MVKISYPRDIQLILNEIIERIKKSLNPDYIILAGSFGKGSWLYSDKELISDFEIVFVCKQRWSLKKKKHLLKNLNNNYPYEISLKGYLKNKVEKKIISNYSSRNHGYISLDFFDTFHDPKIIYSKDYKKLNIDCFVNEIPIWEAWRLYVNRMGDLLKLQCSKNNGEDTSNYYWLKIFESTADAYCIVNNVYHKNISKRLEYFSKELIDNDIELPEKCKASFPIIQKALIARNNHNLLLFDINLDNLEFNSIVISWMGYFEKKLAVKEKLKISKKYNFYYNYNNSSNSLHAKYLGFNSEYSILFSNIFKILSRPKLWNLNFKFYNQNSSWRHIILLTISSTFKEQYFGKYDFYNSKKILIRIFKKKYIDNLKGESFIEFVLTYWKILR